MRALIPLVLAQLLVAGIAGAENWPRFRGNNGDGLSNSESVPTEWNDDNFLWIADLPGTGNASPVVWGKHVFIAAADESKQKRWLICFDKANGLELWRAESQFSSYKKHKNNSYASSTPAVDGDHVYQLWHSRDATSLLAYDHSGTQVWRYELGPYLHGQGGATSPIVVDELVVVAHDHKDESFLVAVDRRSGKEVWKVPREGKRACYSTPCVRETPNGKREVVFVHCYEGVIGVDAETGRRNWHLDPFGRASQRALASPVLSGDLVIAGSGAVGGDRQIVAVKVSGDQATEAYRLVRQSPHVPTPLVIGDRLFLWNDGGIATCCDVESGEVIWQKRVGGQYFGSPIAIGNRIFSIDTAGTVVVIAAEDDFRILARNPLGETSRSSLAASDGALFARTNP